MMNPGMIWDRADVFLSRSSDPEGVVALMVTIRYININRYIFKYYADRAGFAHLLLGWRVSPCPEARASSDL
jgi:hypothetical protein